MQNLEIKANISSKLYKIWLFFHSTQNTKVYTLI
jgi:hypothetical protein